MTEINREYLTNRVLGASPMELIRILYEAAVGSVRQAQGYLRSGEIMERGRAITKACDIISELEGSVNPNEAKEYSERLAALYGYIRRTLMTAHIEKSPLLLKEVEHLLTTLLDGWTQAMHTEAAKAEARTTSQISAHFVVHSENSAVSRSWSF